MRSILPTPPRIVQDGLIHSGYFKEPFRTVNLLDAPLLRNRAVRWSRLKEWVGYGITHPDWYLSMIIQDAKYLGSSALYIYNRASGELREYSCARPGPAVRIAETPWSGSCRIENRDYSMKFEHHLDRGTHKISLDLKTKNGAPSLQGELTLHQDLSAIEPLVLSAPLRPKHHLYTHKTPMPVSGQLKIGSDLVYFDPARDLANLDEHKAFYPYHTQWRWMTFAAFDNQGRVVGVNLSEQMMKDETVMSENCAWFDGRISLLGSAKFDFDPKNPMKPWQITDSESRVNLTFSPEGQKLENRNFGLARINYYQICGRFDGQLIDDAGNKREVPGYYGVCEKMDTHF